LRTPYRDITLALAIGVLLILNPFFVPFHAQTSVGTGIAIAGSPYAGPAAEYPSSPDQILLPPRSYYNQAVQAPGNGVMLAFSIESNEPIDVYVMNQRQFNQFKLSGSMNSLYNYTDISSVSKTVQLGPAGSYYLLMVNDISITDALVAYSYSTVPVDIYLLYDSAPAPVGIVDYGVLDASGTLTPYALLLSQVIGGARINAIQAYNSSFSSPYGASLQLNAVLQANTTAGQYSYFLQNVAEFTTSNNNLYFADNVWNDSSASSVLLSSAISGGGSISNSIGYQPILNRLISFYSYATQNISYTLPLDLLLPIAVSSSGNRVVIYFGYQTYDNPSVTYDRVTITEPGMVLNASILIDGFIRTPIGNYYDAELVFGGENSGELTTFTSMNASLDLYYVMPNGTMTGPASLYTFGSDTAEAAYNLETTLVNGTPTVVIGSPNFEASFTGVGGQPPEINGFPASMKIGDGAEVIIEALIAIAFISTVVILIGRRLAHGRRFENRDPDLAPTEPAIEEKGGPTAFGFSWES